MEGYLAEIRMFAANFAPRYWQYCGGQLLSISANTALFSLLGTTYGGNGVQTFALPDLRGRVAVGTGTGGNAGINVVLGEMAGTSNVTLLSSNLPPHTHGVTAPASASVVGAITASMLVSTDATGAVATPTNQYLGPENGGNGIYESSPTSGKTMNANAISITSNTLAANISTMPLSIAGQNQLVPIAMPSLGMNYVICIAGIFPSRN